MQVDTSYAGRRVPAERGLRGRPREAPGVRRRGRCLPPRPHGSVGGARARLPRRDRAADVRRRGGAARRGAAVRGPRRGDRLQPRRARRRAVHAPPAHPRGRPAGHGAARRLDHRARRAGHDHDARGDRRRGRRAGRDRRLDAWPSARRSHERRLADLAVGTEVARREVTVDRARLVRYAGASGDFNPIHWNARVATSVGLPDVIAHGMWTMGAAVERRRRLGGGPRQGRRLPGALHASRARCPTPAPRRSRSSPSSERSTPRPGPRAST